MINGIQLCNLIRFIKSLASNRKELHKLLTGMLDAMTKDSIDHYAHEDGDAEKTDDTDSEEEWLRKAKKMGVEDVK